MFLRLLAAFILVPFVELFLLLRLAEATSAGWTFLLVITTGVIGSYLAKREGLSTLARFREATASGRWPTSEVRDGVMIAIAAALLLTPGILTDALGFALLIPVTRRIIADWLVRRYSGRFRFEIHQADRSYRRTTDNPSTVDAVWVEKK